MLKELLSEILLTKWYCLKKTVVIRTACFLFSIYSVDTGFLQEVSSYAPQSSTERPFSQLPFVKHCWEQCANICINTLFPLFLCSFELPLN